ncbi:MAG: 50S ribosomal protein L15 [Deltaproteobacteria bacterium]|nr:50S ribosomal protein L15 [Deltaproteobacteria bacterium]
MAISLKNIKLPKGATHKPKRRGRGESSGLGKTSGRGNKGQLSRSGGGTRLGFEGGQMPLIRRIPKRGFYNKFRKEFSIVNVRDLAVFSANDVVDKEKLFEKGLIKSKSEPVKILGEGNLEVALTVKANKFSKTAIEKITKAGGKAEEI